MTKRIPDQPYRFGLLLAALALLFVGSGALEYTQGFLSPRLALAAAELLLAFVLVAAVVNVSRQVRSGPARVTRDQRRRTRERARCPRCTRCPTG